jgi:hypothetical protein
MLSFPLAASSHIVLRREMLMETIGRACGALSLRFERLTHDNSVSDGSDASSSNAAQATTSTWTVVRKDDTHAMFALFFVAVAFVAGIVGLIGWVARETRSAARTWQTKVCMRVAARREHEALRRRCRSRSRCL